MYLDFEYRGYCRKFKTGLILQERKYMKFETINPYSYDMPDESKNYRIYGTNYGDEQVVEFLLDEAIIIRDEEFRDPEINES
jgi:hypothetical protein